MKFIQHGVKELKLRYQGSKAYLSREQRWEIINYLEAQEYLCLQEIREYIEDKYDVRFKSNQSYYTLLEEAKISWNKSQKKHQEKNEGLVEIKKIEINIILEENSSDLLERLWCI